MATITVEPGQGAKFKFIILFSSFRLPASAISDMEDLAEKLGYVGIHSAYR